MNEMRRPASLGADILERLDARKMTQKEFSDRFGIGTTTLNNIIKGKTRLNRDHAAIFANGFDSDIEYWIKNYIDYESKVAGKVNKIENRFSGEFDISAPLPKGVHAFLVHDRVVLFRDDTDPIRVAEKVKAYEACFSPAGRG